MITVEAGLNFLTQGFFFLLLLVFTIYTLFLGYHWFTYGTTYKTAMTALIIYLGGAAVLFLIMASLI